MEALEIIREIPLTTASQNAMANSLVEDALFNGNILEIAVKVKALENVIKAFNNNENIKEVLASQFGDTKTIPVCGCKATMRSVTKYHYELLDYKKYTDILDKIEKLTEQKKDIEKQLASATVTCPVKIDGGKKISVADIPNVVTSNISITFPKE